MNKLKKEERDLDILFICNSLNLGGAEKIMYEVVKDTKSYKREIICLTDDSFYGNLLEKEGIIINYFNLNKNLYDIIKIIKIYLYILSKKPKLIHSFLYHSDVIASILGKLSFTKKILWSVHHDFIPSDNSILRNIQVKFLSIISNYVPDKIIFCSKESLNNHVKLGYSKRKSIIINHGICTKKFSPRKNNYNKIRSLLHIKKEIFLIGHIARFHPDKGHKTLLDALKLLKKEYKNFKCLMVGTNINKRNTLLKKQIIESKLEDNIILYGETKFPEYLITSFDINVISSLSESASLVLLETMASGIPSLATNVGPISNTLGESGWVVKKKSPKDLAEKLIFIINNPSYLNEKSLLAREIILKKYSLNRMLKEYNLSYKLFI